MANLITCSFARVAIREILKKHSNSKHGQISVNEHEKLVHDYNESFSGYQAMQLDGKSKYLAKKFKDLNAIFSRKWQPQIKLKEYCETFSQENWKKLPYGQKYQHSIADCSACPLNFPELDSAFPARSPVAKRKQKDRQIVACSIEASDVDFSAPPTKVAKKLGHDIVTQLSPVCQQMTGMPLSKVLALTPSSGTTQRKSHTQWKCEQRKRMRDVKRSVEFELRKHDSNLLFQRLSYRKYNAIRLTESFESIEKATERTKSKQAQITKKIHGCSESNLPFDGTMLLAEASQWSEEKEVNWTELANCYGVTGGNRGQIVKEFLAQKGIPVAMTKQRQLVRKAKLKLPGGEISYPSRLTVSAQKTELQRKIDNGEILIGEILPPVQFIKFSLDKATKSIVETPVTVEGRKVPLYNIRTKVLKYHEKLGLMRITDQAQITQFTSEKLNKALVVRKISVAQEASDDDKRQLLLQCSTKRSLKLWHDHGKIAGQKHILILVAGIYDPAFYYTSEELAAKSVHLDVEAIVEQPEIHFISRCGSSDAEQFMLNEFRSDCSTYHSQSVPLLEKLSMTHSVFFMVMDLPNSLRLAKAEGGTTHVLPVKHSFTDLMICVTATAAL